MTGRAETVAPQAVPVPKRVLVIDHTGQEGGGEIALLRVAAKLHPERFAVRAIVLSEGPFVGRLREAGIETVVVALDEGVTGAARHQLLSSPVSALGGMVAVLGGVARLVRAIRGSKAELVVANTLKSAVLVSVSAPLSGRRWVWHLHDRLAPDYLPSVLVRAMRLLAVVGPTRIVVNSRAALDTLPARAAAKAVIAYPGVPDEAFTGQDEPELPPIVGILGRLGRTKGQREFLEAAAIVAGRRAEVRFRVIGKALFNDDEYEHELHELPAALGIADRVEFTGWAADPAAELASLSLLVHASPVPEPFGQVLVEAMAAGVPVVGTDAGGATEIVDPDASATGIGVEAAASAAGIGVVEAAASAAGAGVVEGAASATAARRTPFGQLVPPGDVAALAEAIEWALDHREEAARIAVHARESARSRFSIDRTADVVAATWSSALRRAG